MCCPEAVDGWIAVVGGERDLGEADAADTEKRVIGLETRRICQSRSALGHKFDQIIKNDNYHANDLIRGILSTVVKRSVRQI